jgi:hypothetical protein
LRQDYLVRLSSALPGARVLCLIGANGACKQVIEEVAGTTSILAVAAQEFDLNTAVGRATVLGACFADQCYDVCFTSTAQ